MRLSGFRSRIPIKKFMVGYLAALLIFGAFGTNDLNRILRGAVIVTLCAAVDLFWTKIRDKKWYLPLSSFISGLIIANLLSPQAPWGWLIFAPVAAAAFKQLIHWGPRHIFNPAGLALIVVGIFFPGAISWWGAAWGPTALAVVGIVGVFILWRQQRFHIVLPFLAIYALGLAGLLLRAGVSVSDLPAIMRRELIDGTLFFFTTIMLIEPITTSFATRKIRMIYGAIVGALAIAVSLASRFVPISDALIAAMLGGNLIVTLATIKKAR